MIQSLLFFLSGQLAGGVILGVALWLRHDNQTSSLLLLQFEGHQAPGTFYISEYRFLSCSLSCRNPDFLLNGSMLCPCSHLYYPSQSSVLQPCRVNCNAAIDPPHFSIPQKKNTSIDLQKTVILSPMFATSCKNAAFSN